LNGAVAQQSAVFVPAAAFRVPGFVSAESSSALGVGEFIHFAVLFRDQNAHLAATGNSRSRASKKKMRWRA